MVAEPTPTPIPEPTPQPSEPGAAQNNVFEPQSVDGASSYALGGFAAGVTGGGVIAENTSTYRKVYTASDLAAALKKGSGVKVIEIMNDLNLGWNEIPAAAKTAPFAQHSNAPLTHPVLLKSGVSNITVEGFDGLTIFSTNGSKIKHATITVKRSSNLVIRNLEFDELWEWDEATKGDYDRNDWDYLTIENSHKVWIDHSTFHKAYDGLVDVKKGSTGVTISWSKFMGDNQSSTGWVAQQINAMEKSRAQYPMYDYLRSLGLSAADIIAIASGQKKGHLIGATDFASDNANLQVTLHHNYYQNIQDRMPRLRGGNVHAYNIVMDASGTLAAKQRLTSKIESAIKSKGYHFGVTSNGAISTEGGSVLLEGSQIIDVLSPVRNNQVSASKSEYTGKIKVVDTIYTLKGQTFRGGSETSGSPLAPKPAAVKPFAWNGFSKLPYSYTVENPSGLKEKLSSASGAGVLSLSKAEWMKTVEK
ncbi:pectate lyase family protein [Saccharibacillus kuerlensis]|uniref:pectate lyase family protein n=1 Tax=Saccharibacillus kuerlensis TaxID=459527 RepID=UPI003CC7DC1C